MPTTPLPRRASPGGRIVLSWLAAGVGTLVGFWAASAARAENPALATSTLFALPLVATYAGWALFWGTSACWRWL